MAMRQCEMHWQMKAIQFIQTQIQTHKICMNMPAESFES